MQEGRKWLFQVKFFSFKSAWIFSCAFQLSSTTFPCIFFAWFALCFWEKQRQNIEACTMNRTKQNKSISARKRYRRMFFYLIEKHMQKFRHFWRKKISPEKVTYVPLAPSHSIMEDAKRKGLFWSNVTTFLSMIVGQIWGSTILTIKKFRIYCLIIF